MIEIFYLLIGVGFGLGAYKDEDDALIAVFCAIIWPLAIGYKLYRWGESDE